MIANCDIKLSTIIEGGTGTFSSSLEQPADMPERLESGTINTPGIIACAAGIDFVASKTLSKIHSYEMELIQRLYVELGNIERVELYTEYPTERNNVAVLSFNIKEMPSESAAEYLSEAGFAVRAGLHCARPRIGLWEQMNSVLFVQAFQYITIYPKLCSLHGKLKNFPSNQPQYKKV